MTATDHRGATNERVELARYTISAGERVIYGQRILGVVRVVDVPASGRGRRYVIERELTSMAELEAIVADYVRQAARWDAIPPSRHACATPSWRQRPDDPARRRCSRAAGAHRTRSHDRHARGGYVERRERGDAPCAHDLLAVAAEHGEAAVDALRDVLAFYGAMRAIEAGIR